MKKYILGLFIFLTHGAVFCFSEAEDRAHQDWLYREGFTLFSIACGTQGRHEFGTSDSAPFFVQMPVGLASDIKQKCDTSFSVGKKKSHEIRERIQKVDAAVRFDIRLTNLEKEALSVKQLKDMPIFFKINVLNRYIRENAFLFNAEMGWFSAEEYAHYIFLMFKNHKFIRIINNTQSAINAIERELMDGQEVSNVSAGNDNMMSEYPIE